MPRSQNDLNLATFPSAEAVYLAISGMTCPRCAVYINNALQQLTGVVLSFMLFEQNLVALLYDPGQTSADDMVNIISGLNDGHHHFQARVVARASAGDIFV
jgi:copper chaperone CopZ